MAQFNLKDFMFEDFYEEFSDAINSTDAIILTSDNLADLRKAEYIVEIFDKYTLEQLEEKLK